DQQHGVGLRGASGGRGAGLCGQRQRPALPLRGRWAGVAETGSGVRRGTGPGLGAGRMTAAAAQAILVVPGSPGGASSAAGPDARNAASFRLTKYPRRRRMDSPWKLSRRDLLWAAGGAGVTALTAAVLWPRAPVVPPPTQQLPLPHANPDDIGIDPRRLQVA